jgi:hypothetical protein
MHGKYKPVLSIKLHLLQNSPLVQLFTPVSYCKGVIIIIITAIGLTPGDSSIHLHTSSTQNTEDGTHITITRKQTITRKKLGSAGRAPSLLVIPWHLPYN